MHCRTPYCLYQGLIQSAGQLSLNLLLIVLQILLQNVIFDSELE